MCVCVCLCVYVFFLVVDTLRHAMKSISNLLHLSTIPWQEGIYMSLMNTTMTLNKDCMDNESSLCSVRQMNSLPTSILDHVITSDFLWRFSKRAIYSPCSCRSVERLEVGICDARACTSCVWHIGNRFCI